MSNRTQALLLLLLGAALLRIGATDVLLRFVRPSARPWVLIAGAALLLLAVWSLVADARAGSDAHADAHGHHGATRLAWLVAAPVVAVLVIAPQALGAFSADRRANAVTSGQGDGGQQNFDPLPAGNPVSVTLFDLATRAVLGHGTSLVGRTVRVMGFVSGTHAGTLTIARLVITCCAADAAPVFARVRGSAGTPAFPRNTWVEVVGTYAGVTTDGSDIPMLHASSIRRVVAPANPYD